MNETCQISSWLIEEEYEGFQSAWESQQKIREELKEEPDELKLLLLFPQYLSLNPICQVNANHFEAMKKLLGID